MNHISSKIKVLIVEDNTDIIKYLRAILSEFDYELYYSVDGEKSVSLIQEIKPDIVLLDMMLPSTCGLDILKTPEIQAMTRDTAIIVMTASTDKAIKVESLKAGAVDYINKPMDKDEIIHKVANHARMISYRKELDELKTHQEQLVRERTEELYSATEKLRGLDQRKSEFLALISHEMRTPLNGLQGLQLIDKTKLDKEGQLMIQMSMECSDRLVDFADKALLMTNLKSNGLNNSLISHPVKEIFNQFINHQERNNISVDTENINPDLSLYCCFDLINKAITQIMLNSFEYATSKVSVSALGDGNHLRILIQDDGDGFPDKILSGGISAFVTSDIFKHHSGHGVGLYLAETIIKMHDGEILISNNGEGALVELVFPLL